MRVPLPRMRQLALGAALALAGIMAEAAPPAYTDRPAIKVRNVAGAVMLGVARAGKRLVAVGEHGFVALSDDDGRSWPPSDIRAGGRDPDRRAVLRCPAPAGRSAMLA